MPSIQSIPAKDVGNRIRFLRQANQYTRDDFAKKIEISSKFLYEIENGKKGFSVEILFKISKVLSVSCDYLLFGTVDEKISVDLRGLMESFEPDQMQYMEVILKAMLGMCKHSAAKKEEKS